MFDQIFLLLTIIEESQEWNTSFYINFIDFEKAFDSIHHPTMWNILRSYGFPEKIVCMQKTSAAFVTKDNTVICSESNLEFANDV